MYQIHFFKCNGGTDRIYVWGSDLDKARFHIENHQHTIVRIDECPALEWLYYAYIKEPHKRFKKWWL